MNEFIEKLIGRLEEESRKIGGGNTFLSVTVSDGLDMAVDIVKELAEEYKIKTNADRIRNMSDEELAELFTTWSCEDADYTTLLQIEDCKWGTKKEIIERNLKWLQSEEVK